MDRRILAVVLLLPGAQAAFLEDPPGDADPLGVYDLGALTIVETPSHLAFVVDGHPPAGWTTVAFRHGVAYELRITQDQEIHASLWRQDATWLHVEDVPARVDGELVEASVPRQLLVDASGAVPERGRVLDDLAVTTGVGDMTWDRMPDAGTARYDVQWGGLQEGDARLQSRDPTRTSNGEATTYLFQVQASHAGDAPASYDLRWTEPPGWNITLPVAAVRLGPDQTITLPVIVRTPFGHAHGGRDTFAVTMAGPTGSAEVTMGVAYTVVPQPAGHHDVLRLHGQGPMTMSTATPEEGRAPADAWIFDGSLHGTWRIPLSPRLATGLVFDVARTGEALWVLEGALPTQATVSARLLLEPTGEELGTFGNASVSVNGRGEGTAAYTPGKELIVYQPDQQLVLEVNVTSVAPVELHTASSLRLPLIDYEDAVDEAITGVPGMVLYGAPHVTRDPGGTAVFLMDADVEGVVRWQAQGDWARVEPAETEGEHLVEIIVAVPDDARPGERSDITVVAIDEHGGVGVLRLVVDVGSGGSLEDERLGTEAQESPLGPLALVAVALTAWLHRNRDDRRK